MPWQPRFAGWPVAPAPGRGRRPCRARPFGCSTGISIRPRCSVCCEGSHGPASRRRWRLPGISGSASATGSGRAELEPRAIAAATDRGVMVVNAPQSNVLSAAEHTMALLLAQAVGIEGLGPATVQS